MAQPPFKTDVLQIEPAASGMRTIDRDPTLGELRFTDPSFPSGVVLAQLVGVQTIPSTFVVGTGGGAQYTTIQAAIDAIPTTGSAVNPQVILVFPGTYNEKLTIDKDGVVLVGQGFVSIVNNDADPTIHVVQGSVTQIPRFVRFVNLNIVAEDDGSSCLHLDGSNTFATGSFTIATAPLAAGDVLTIGGLNLTGIAGGRTSGADNFNCTLGSTAALAAEIVAALNDPSNSFATTVTAALGGSYVDLTAVVPGSGGNTITLAATTVPPGGITPSGATLTNGGGQGSLVGVDGIEVLRCDFAATGIGTKQIVAETVNRVTVSGGSWQGSSSTSLSTVSQTAFFSLNAVEWVSGLEVAYDIFLDEPDAPPDGWTMQNVGRAGTLLINLVGTGYTFITGCPLVGHTTHNGDRTFRAVGSVFGNMLVEDTVAATLINCARGTLGGTGTGTVQESSVVGSVSFAASALEVVTFPVAQPNAGYTVVLDVPSISVTAGVTSRTAAGFTVETSVPYTGSIGYSVLRQLT
jgi:hypothetical protein